MPCCKLKGDELSTRMPGHSRNSYVEKEDTFPEKHRRSLANNYALLVFQISLHLLAASCWRF